MRSFCCCLFHYLTCTLAGFDSGWLEHHCSEEKVSEGDTMGSTRNSSVSIVGQSHLKWSAHCASPSSSWNRKVTCKKGVCIASDSGIDV